MDVTRVQRAPVPAFVIGAVLVGVTMTIGLLLSPSGRTVPALGLVIPVLVTAIIGGRTASLAVGALAGLAFATAFLPPIGSPAVRFAEDVLALVVFLVVAVAISALLTVTLDAERRRRHADEERLAVLEAVDDHRRALLRSVSHELRTPLGIVHGAATELEERDAAYQGPARRQLLELLTSETARMERIVANLLAMSRIDAGVWRAERELVDVGDLITSAARRVAGASCGPPITVAVDPELPAVLADPVQLDLVVANLIDNALRHGPDGHPVRIVADREPGHVRVTVIDEGPGVDPSLGRSVFEPFVAGPGGATTGIGLALCQAIVTEHGGTIRLEPACEREGTAAVVRLPHA